MQVVKVFFLILSFSISSFAVTPTTVQTFENKNCKETNSCNLERFELKTFDTLDTEYDGKRIRASWSQTLMEGSLSLKSDNSVNEFAVVQYIKGCVFTKTQFDTDLPEYGHNQRYRIFFGEKINGFSHPEFVIDSIDEDPIYASRPFDRHGNYKVLLKKGASVLFSDRKDWAALSQNPVIPQRPTIYFSDMPTGSYFSKSIIRAGENKGRTLRTEERASMVFKTCVFKTADVPRDLSPEDTDSSKAIKCFEWSNSQKYNEDLNKFEFNNKVDNNCPKE